MEQLKHFTVLLLVGFSSAAFHRTDVPEPKYDLSLCEEGMFMRDYSNFCRYHVCMKRGNSYTTIPFDCPAGTSIPIDYTMGSEQPCSNNGRDELNNDCTMKADDGEGEDERDNKQLDEGDCDVAALFRCGFEKCHSEDKCIDFIDVPRCVDQCKQDHCVGYIKNQAYVKCGGIEPYGRLFTACGSGCFRNPTVRAADFDFADADNQKFIGDCLGSCFNTACRKQEIGCQAE